MSSWHEWREAPRADYAVLGDPVSHSLSPAMHRAAYRALGLDLRYEAIRVPEREFAEALDHLKALGYQGVNCTVPLKTEAFRWARLVEPFDQKLGVLNTLRLEDRAGINTDAPGLLETLEEHGVGPSRPVLVLGAGGTAASAVPALVGRGFRVRVWNRTSSRVRDLCDRVGSSLATVAEHPDPSGCGLVLHTTSAGVRGDSPPVRWDRAPKDLLAYDAFYTHGLTPFLLGASEHGLRCLDGRALLAAQGALSLEWWLGKIAPRTAMLEAIR